MFRRTLFIAVIAVAAMAGSAYAGSRWLITSTRQIKPSVLAQLRTRIVQVTGPTAYLCPNNGTGGGACTLGRSVATCPKGATVLGGGWDSESNPGNNTSVSYNYPTSKGTWQVILNNNDVYLGAQFHAVATCAMP